MKVTSAARTITSADPGSDRYREAERSLWHHYGLEPNQRFVEVSSPAVRLRVVEVGSGPPVLFIPGTAGTGPYWGSLVRALGGYRCLMVDRPGWGLSAPLDYTGIDYGTVVADLLRGLLDTLEIEKADVVGSSIGDLWALRLASRHPARVGRVVLLGGGPIVADSGIPGIIRLIASPIGAIMLWLPPKPARVKALMRRAGHGASLDAGLIPDEYVRWRVAFERETDSMRNERAMVRSTVSWRTGLRTGIAFEDAELAAAQWRLGGRWWIGCLGAHFSSWMAPGTCRGSTTRPASQATSAAFSPHSQPRASPASPQYPSRRTLPCWPGKRIFGPLITGNAAGGVFGSWQSWMHLA
jgi:pimeloyl-ACP methyl ester carboxylesterase